MRLYTVSDIRHIEQEVFRRTPPFTVMRMAGEAMAAEVLRRSPPPSTTLVLVGEGNNGGDGYIAARALHEAGQRVRLIAAAPPKTPDAQKARTLWEECGKTENPESGELPAADGIIDALFGIGLSRPPTGIYRQLIEQANAAATPVWAIDCPSGSLRRQRRNIRNRHPSRSHPQLLRRQNRAIHRRSPKPCRRSHHRTAAPL